MSKAAVLYRQYMRHASDVMGEVPAPVLMTLLEITSDDDTAFRVLDELGPNAVQVVLIAAAATIATELERRRLER